LGYRIRVLGKNLVNISLSALREVANPAIIEADEGSDDTWEQIILKHDSGEAIAFIEKNPVIEGELASEEILEFINEVNHYKPASAVSWLHGYLPTVKVIYSFQLLSGTEINDGWARLHSVYSSIWNHAGGILQADSEGFSNEQGFTILWQFADEVTGAWNMGVLASNNQWTHFEMDLGNRQHREAFLRGQLPEGAKLL
jgi:hypothetical protein